MPRPLSTPEFLQFEQDNADLIASINPGQFKIVSWNGMSILAYVGPNYVNVDGALYPDIYLTDVSNATQLQAMLQPGYTAPPQSMLDTLPQAVSDTIAEDAAKAGALINSAGQAAMDLLKKAAGAAEDAASALVWPVVIGAVLLLYLVSRR